MNKLKAVLKLTRIEHSIMLVIAVLAAEMMAGGLPGMGVMLLSLIAPAFISMASFAINDYFDIEVDRLNKKKNRPLVNGSLKPVHALYITIITLVIGVAASAFINFNSFVIALAFALLAVLYSYKLKEMFFLGNAYVALTYAIPFVFGNYVVSNELAISILLVSAMCFLSGLAREIHGTIRDYEGDVKARKVRTFPKVIGINASAVLALLLYVAAVSISAFLFLNIAPFMSNLAYAAIISVNDLMFLYVGFGYLLMHSSKFYNKTRSISLLAMGIALIAIALAPIFRI